MTPRPTSLRILSLDYEVRWVAVIDEAFGSCDSSTQVIEIVSDLPRHRTATTFLHELLHAIAEAMDLQEPILEESLCQRVSVALICAWQQNPEAFQWFKEQILP